MPFELKYKVVNKYVQHITDIEATFGGARDPVRLVHPLPVTFNRYIDFTGADSDQIRTSLSEGLLKFYIDNKHIVEVYVDTGTGAEVSKADYLGRQSEETTTVKTEADKIAELLSSKGITAESLAKMLESLNKVPETPILKTYQEFSQLKYQDKLNQINKIDDIGLLENIIQNEKSVAFIKKASSRLNQLRPK